MRRLVSSVFISLLFLSLFNQAIFIQSASAVIVDRIVAVVNGKVITLLELEKRAAPILKKYITPDMSEDEKEQLKQQVYARILPQMIDDYLVDQEIKRLGIHVSDHEVEAAIDNICKNNGITRKEFIQKLKEEGISLEKYKKQIATQIKRLRLINAQVRSKIVVTDQQVKEYIQKQEGSDEYGGPYYILDHICIVPDSDSPSAKEMAKKRAEEALKALKSGMPFEEVAHKYSSNTPAARDVRLGTFSLDEMAPYIRKAVKDLSPGEYSGIIETPIGFEILRLVTISNAKSDQIDKTQLEEVRKKLYDQLVNERFQQWLNELRSKSTIRILL